MKNRRQIGLRSWATAAALSLLSGSAAAAEPTGAIDGNATAMLSPARLAGLPPAGRAAWQRYLETSDRVRAADHAAMEAELRSAGKARMTPGPYRQYFHLEPAMTPAWFAGDEAQRAAVNMISFQTPAGGWSKRVEIMQRARQPGESYFSENDGWSYIATIDNDSTTEELRFLGAAHAARPDPRTRDAFIKGLGYLLEAQFPNGCWPQVYPLQGGYHDAATYNDNAIINVMKLLDDVGSGQFPLVPAVERRRAAAAAARGLPCILASQVVVRGARTVWGQQHDPLTLAPVAARSYELSGLCGRESAVVAAYLMSLPAPDPAVVEAVHAAVAWFRGHEIFGYDYDVKTGLEKVAGAGPLWARLYEIETDRPIFSNRDGVKRYDWNQLTDRRQGYTWYTKEPARVLERYESWRREHPAARRVQARRR